MKSRTFRKTRTGKTHLPTCYHAETNYEKVQYTAETWATKPWLINKCGACIPFDITERTFKWSNE